MRRQGRWPRYGREIHTREKPPADPRPGKTERSGGAEIGTFFSCALEKKLTKHPEEFGNGAIEGVAGPEAANNASAAGTLVPLIGLWVRLLTIPKPWLYAGILLFATLGTIGANPSVVELGMLLAFGLLGYGLRVFGFPIAPVVIGLILGPMAEQQLRRALAISQGDVSVLFTSPISAVLLGIAAIALIVPMILRATGRGKALAQLEADTD